MTDFHTMIFGDFIGSPASFPLAIKRIFKAHASFFMRRLIGDQIKAAPPFLDTH